MTDGYNNFLINRENEVCMHLLLKAKQSSIDISVDYTRKEERSKRRIDDIQVDAIRT